MHRGEVPPLTHDLTRLLRRLEGHEVETENLQSLGQLTLFAVQVRYDVDPQPREPQTQRKGRPQPALPGRLGATGYPASCCPASSWLPSTRRSISPAGPLPCLWRASGLY